MNQVDQIQEAIDRLTAYGFRPVRILTSREYHDSLTGTLLGITKDLKITAKDVSIETVCGLPVFLANTVKTGFWVCVECGDAQ